MEMYILLFFIFVDLFFRIRCNLLFQVIRISVYHSGKHPFLMLVHVLMVFNRSPLVHSCVLDYYIHIYVLNIIGIHKVI